MNWKTTALLMILLTSLGALVLWQQDREANEVHLVDERLFEGVDASAVTEIRIDNIYRGFSMRLERDAQNYWHITDPLNYPADAGYVDALLKDVRSARVVVVGDQDASEEDLGFAPPAVVLEVTELTAQGERKHKVEVGAVDLDGVRVYVRRDGRYFRALRRLHNTLNREIDEWRSPRVIQLLGRKVVEVHRSGALQKQLEVPPEDLAMHAYLEGGVWRSVLPFEARLDPMDVGLLVQGIARLEVERYIEDEAQDLTIYALDKPLASMSLGFSDGSRETLLVSRIGNTSRWFAMREGGKNVVSLDDGAITRLTWPFELMLERHFMNARRGDVSALLLANEREELRVVRGPRDWTVEARSLGGPWSPALRADRRKVEEWLGKLETLEVERFLLEEDPAVGPAPASVEARMSLHVETPSGLQGGRLGALRAGDEGEMRRLYRRDGDEVEGLLPTWTAELAQSTRYDFLSMDIVTLEEVEQVGLELRSGERVLNYTRDARGLWHVVGEEAEALELLSLLDPLLFVRASEHLEGAAPLEQAIHVTFTAHDGQQVSYAVGLGKDDSGAPRAELDFDGTHAVAKFKALHEGLLGLFGE